MTPPFPIRDLAFAGMGYVAAITSLQELSEMQLMTVVFLLGGMFGASGKMIRARKSEALLQSIVVGMAMALLGILFASMWEHRIGRNASVGLSLVLAMMGADGAKWLMKEMKTKLSALVNQTSAKS